jgi:hypothetical protein
MLPCLRPEIVPTGCFTDGKPIQNFSVYSSVPPLALRDVIHRRPAQPTPARSDSVEVGNLSRGEIRLIRGRLPLRIMSVHGEAGCRHGRLPRKAGPQDIPLAS